jgi:histone H3/H4
MADDMLLVKSRVQELIRDQGCSPSSEAIDELNGVIQDAVEEAAERTKANGRKRVKAADV